MALTNRRLDLPELQRTIDQGNFLVPLVLDQVQPAAGNGPLRGTLGREPVTFRLDEVEIGRLAMSRKDLAKYHHAVSISGSGDLKPCAAGGVALWAYCSAGNGAFFQPSTATVYTLPDLKKYLDAMLATAFGLVEEYLELYPEDKPIGGGEVFVEASLA
jgi:hypothetical protein